MPDDLKHTLHGQKYGDTYYNLGGPKEITEFQGGTVIGCHHCNKFLMFKMCAIIYYVM